MKIISTPALSPGQRAKIQSLLDACLKNDALSFSFPFEDADLFLIAELSDQIPAIAAFTDLGSDAWECTAFTHPGYRRQGYFQALLESGISHLPLETDLLFYVDPRSTDAVRTMDALEAEFYSSEHMMEYRFPSDGVHFCTPDCGLSMTESHEEGDLLFSYEGIHGHVRIAVRESHYYLYDFEIDRNCRGQGCGQKLLHAVIADLYARSPLPIRLQVSGDNLPALSLYKKTGFRITETLSCFLY